SSYACHVDAPGFTRGLQGVDQSRVGEFIEVHVGQTITLSLAANHGDLLKAGTWFDGCSRFVAGSDSFAGAVVDAPGEVGVDFAAVVGVDDGEAGAGGLFGALAA